jgi:hypothetical protein
MAELSITNNTLLKLLIAGFFFQKTLTSIVIMLTHKTNIVQILTIIIVPYNLCHKFISKLIQKLRETQQQLLKLKK